MITIQSGKMLIPEEERFVGFAGDDRTNTKQFILPQTVDSGCTYTLYLRFDDDRVTSAPLTARRSDGGVILTWEILARHLLKAGVVMAQLKIVSPEEEVTHSGWDYFVVGASAELADDGGEIDVLHRTEFEERLAELDSSKVDKTTRVAGLPLSGSIRAVDLYENLSSKINPTAVIVGYSEGMPGQYGRSSSGAPVFCREADSWTALAEASDVPSKTSELTNDSGFLTQHQDISGKEDRSNKVTALSSSSTDTQYPTAKCVYDLVGNIESLLAQI